MKRIQRRRERGWRMPEGARYVGRPTRWGNPWRVDEPLGRDLHWDAQAVVDLYAAVARADAEIDPDGTAAWLAPLRGHDLACWCRLCDEHADGKPAGVRCDRCEPCHADVLLELLEARA